MEAVRENRAAVVVGLGTDVSEKKQKDLSLLGAALPSDIRQINKGPRLGSILVKNLARSQALVVW
jgi:hypothetical protein